MDYRVRNLLFVVLSFALLASLSVMVRRVAFEHADRTVQLVMDFDDVEMLARSEGVKTRALLKRIRSAGVGTIALCEDTLTQAERRGALTWVRGSDLFNVYRVTKGLRSPFSIMLANGLIDPQKFYLQFTSLEYYRRVRDELLLVLGRTKVRELRGNILEVDDDEMDLAFLGVGLPHDIYAMLKAEGFMVIPRIKNSYWLTDDKISRKLNLQNISYDDRVVLFDEEEILGYPYYIRTTAKELLGRNLLYGYIEFSDQLGYRLLARLMGEKVIRTHSIPSDEMEIMTERAAIARWGRAVFERGVRILYIHPLPRPSAGRTLVETNIAYLERLGGYLRAGGLAIGFVDAGKRLDVRFFEAFLIALGVVAASLILFSRFFPVADWAVYIALLASAFLMVVSHSLGGFLLLRKITAFFAAVSFPSLAVIEPFAEATAGAWDDSAAKKLLIVLKGFLISLCGALFVSGLLSETLFKNGSDQFLGVKFALVLPLMIIAAYFFFDGRYEETFRKLMALLSAPVQILHLVVIGALGAFGLLFILRSGNFGIGVPGFERSARDIMETLLIVRPRTKEILIGYPALVLTLQYFRMIPRDWLWLPLAVSGVAFVSIVNTFCHIHSPFMVSLIRSVNGLVVGIILGLLLWGAVEAVRMIVLKRLLK